MGGAGYICIFVLWDLSCVFYGGRFLCTRLNVFCMRGGGSTSRGCTCGEFVIRRLGVMLLLLVWGLYIMHLSCHLIWSCWLTSLNHQYT